MYSSQYKLFELENILPSSFVRISKSAISNVMQISSLTREIVGNGSVRFFKTEKMTYFSRAYYKILRDRIEEIRFS
jgi:DNA-binding LytR/AlgR family response regulator